MLENEHQSCNNIYLYMGNDCPIFVLIWITSESKCGITLYVGMQYTTLISSRCVRILFKDNVMINQQIQTGLFSSFSLCLNQAWIELYVHRKVWTDIVSERHLYLCIIALAALWIMYLRYSMFDSLWPMNHLYVWFTVRATSLHFNSYC